MNHAIHIDAKPGDIAETVLLPGDPLRARFLAGELLSDTAQVNSVRNMLGYTGCYRGRPVSIIGSGMGIPSTAIYATELARYHAVRRIIRIGTCGAVSPDVELGDVLIAQSASTDSNFNRLHFSGHDLAACADFALLRALVTTAERQKIRVRVGGVFSTDCFYNGDPALIERLLQHRILGIEMEAAGLYGLALREGFAAAAVLTVSDHVQRKEHLSAEARERGAIGMAALVLDSLCQTAA
ncbi:MAG TPA: purine-nucleoside phosphorylase [Rhodanobacteraceae bacterium]|jgi:purine-nucleoside phosphorylase|nr:purine-nucleoside phosphorylase [Rhodanobacteraceae bacterium]